MTSKAAQTELAARAVAGMLLVDKPLGVSSFAVVNAVRQALVRAFPDLVSRRRSGGGPRPPRFKCGHAGTLDPAATGLLVVLVGRASRLSQFLLGLDKTYAATVRFGTATDTLDADGQIVGTSPVPADPALLAKALPRFRGELSQAPPVISALKRNGQPLYKLARAGHDVPAPEPRPVTIRRLELTATRWGGQEPEADLVVACSSGTYIRSLARDLAAEIGTLGHLRQLRRLEVGPFALSAAVEDVLQMDGQTIARHLQPLTAALPQLPRLELTAAEAEGIRLGQQPAPAWLERLDGPPVALGKAQRDQAGPLYCLVDGAGALVAVGRLDEESGQPRIALVIPRQENQ